MSNQQVLEQMLKDADAQIVKLKSFIVEKLLQVNDLEFKLTMQKMAARNIYGFINNIGGPLNDNKYNYSNEQLKIFRDIVSELENAEDAESNRPGHRAALRGSDAPAGSTAGNQNQGDKS